MQALVSEPALGTPRRAVVGWDPSRLAMILAVLEARCGMRFGSHDVYLNVAGGLRLTEPAADLAVAAALVSSRAGRCDPAGERLFRRGQPVGRGAAGGAGGRAAERGGTAGFSTGGSALPAAAKVSRSTLTLNEVTTLADIVAAIAADSAAKGAARRFD